MNTLEEIGNKVGQELKADRTRITALENKDPVITLAGDATGSVTLANLGSGTLNVTVVDDSHNHVIANVDGLQTVLDAKLGSTANAVSATKLATARTINGVSFDGTANIIIADATKAPLASPALTGTPTAPTAAVGTNTTQLATTAFVQAEIANDAPTKTGTGASGTWGISVTGNAGTVTNGVYTTGDQTIAGVKTFSSSPVVPTATTSGQAVNSNNIFGFKNYIINGNFDIWQRGTHFTTSGYMADRWNCAVQNAIITSSANGTNPVTTATANNSFGNYYQSIEFLNANKLLGKTVTLSFRLISGTGITGSIVASVKYNTVSDASSNTWTTINGVSQTLTAGQNVKNSVTCTIPVDAKGIQVAFEQSVVQDSGKQWGVYEVQLEEGSIATPFEQRPLGLELSLCQRYYEVVNVILEGYTNTTWWGNEYKFAVDKRVAPSITAVGTPHFENIYSNAYYINSELLYRGSSWEGRNFKSSMYVALNATGINGFQRFSTVLAVSAEL